MEDFMNSKRTKLVFIITMVFLISSCVSYDESQAKLSSTERYNLEITNKIIKNCNFGYKSSYFDRSAKQEAVVSVSISSEGNLQDINFDEEADDPAFNDMIKNAIVKSEPFPPFPHKYLENPYKLSIRFKKP